MSTEKQETIIMRPFALVDNEYIKLTSQALKMAGYRVVPRKGNVLSSDGIILNWFENIDSDHELLEYLKKILTLLLLKLLRKKIVFVLHNRQQHDKKNTYNKKLTQKLVLWADRIMILCDESYTVLKEIGGERLNLDKVHKVVLPNYNLIYPNPEKACNEGCITFLFVGVIRPYKNIEMVIKAFKEIKSEKGKKLIIKGACKDNKYKEYLLQTINDDPEIEIEFGYIENEAYSRLIKSADVMVLPFHKESMLNSSTIMLAFSNMRTVVAPWIGTLKEYSDKDFFYAYDYSTEEDHLKKLKEKMQLIATEYNNNKSILAEKGIQAYDCVCERNSLEVIADQYRELLG